MLVLAKSPGIYRTRITNSIALLFLGAGFGVLYHYVGLRAIGQIVPMLTFIMLMVCLFAGVHLTSDSIAKEKREGTLGLLFLTHLTSFQIVIGKLIAHGLMGFYSVLIVVPLLSLIMIVGGVQWLDVMAIAVAGFNTLFFSCAVGLYASSRQIERKKAGASGTWTVVFFWWGIPVLVQLLAYLQFPLWLGGVLRLFAVNGMFNSAFAGPRVRMLDAPWLSLLCTHLLAWVFIGLATFFVRTRWQDQPAKARFSLREWWTNLSIGSPKTRRRLREKLLDQNPFLWLASRDRLRSLGVWIITIGFLCFMAWQFRAGAGAFGVVLSLSITLCIVHIAAISSTSAHQLAVEQEQGTLEMLLSTPLSVATVLKGQFLATMRQVRGPVLLCLLVQILIMAMIFFWSPFGNQNVLGALGVAANAIMYLFDLYTMIWAGMWGVVIVKEAKNAAGAAMIRIIVLPALVFGIVVTSGAFANWYWNWKLSPGPEMVVGFWFLLVALNNVAWLIYIRKWLPQRLREFALRRYSPEEKLSSFGRLGARLGRLFRVGRSNARREPPVLSSPPV